MLQDSEHTYTHIELREKLAAFSKQDWGRLYKVLGNRCRGLSVDQKEILQIALASAMKPDGKKCPKNVDIFRFFDMAIRNVISNEFKKLKRRRDRYPLAVDDESGATYEPPDDAPSIEEKLIDDEERQKRKQAIFDLFKDDDIALLLVEGMMEGMKRRDLMELTGLDDKAYDSKRRKIKRRLNKAFSKDK